MNNEKKYVISEVKLVTMTIGYVLNKYINLHIINKYLDLDNIIIGIKCNNICRGKVNKNNKNTDFKNQCTLILKVIWYENNIEYIKEINAKLFNNGKIIFTGCTNIDQIKILLKHIISKLENLEGVIENIEKSFKSLDNRESVLNKNIIEYLKIKTNNEPFYKSQIIINKKKTRKPPKETTNFIYKTENDTNYKSIYNLYMIIKIYFSKEIIISNDPIIYEFIDKVLLINETIIFPIYYDKTDKLIYNENKINIININSRLNCGFLLNRTNLTNIFKKYPIITNVEYDEAIYAGIKVLFDNKSIIIFFNSGNINITSAKTLDENIKIRDFIVEICDKHYNEICIEPVKKIIKNKYEHSLPNTITIENNNYKYILLKKSFIESNKRNLLILNTYKC